MKKSSKISISHYFLLATSLSIAILCAPCQVHQAHPKQEKLSPNDSRSPAQAKFYVVNKASATFFKRRVPSASALSVVPVWFPMPTSKMSKRTCLSVERESQRHLRTHPRFGWTPHSLPLHTGLFVRRDCGSNQNKQPADRKTNTCQEPPIHRPAANAASVRCSVRKASADSARSFSAMQRTLFARRKPTNTATARNAKANSVVCGSPASAPRPAATV